MAWDALWVIWENFPRTLLATSSSPSFNLNSHQCKIYILKIAFVLKMTNRKNVQIIKWAKMHFLGNIWWPPLFPNSPMRYFLLYSVESPDLKSGIIVTTVWKKLGPILQNGRHGIEIDRIMGKRGRKAKNENVQTKAQELTSLFGKLVMQNWHKKHKI